MFKDGQPKHFQIEHIRPYQVLRIFDRFSDEIKFFMPQAQGSGSLSAIESLMLIKLIRVVDATYIFEFGTYKGLTTRLLLENLPDKTVKNERIFTLDLPSLEGIAFQGDDGTLAVEALDSQRKYLSSKNSTQVHQILQDSLNLDETQFLKKFQLIFIDGNHYLKYLQSDTEKSFAMLADKSSCIVWHDYGNPQFPELTAYIEKCANSIKIYHIEETMLAFHLTDKDVTPRDLI